MEIRKGKRRADVLMKIRQHVLQVLTLPEVITVEQGNVSTTRTFQACVSRDVWSTVRDADHTSRQIEMFQRGFCETSRIVGGAIVDDDQLKVFERLLRHRLDAFHNEPFPIVDGHDD